MQTLPGLPGPAPEPPDRPAVLPLLPPFPRQPDRRRPLPDSVAVCQIPLPESAPPFDDQASGERPAAAGPGAPGPEQPPAGRPPAPGRPPARLPGGPTLVPGPGEWPGQFAQALAEALAGSRPSQQITPWTTEQARRRIRQLGPALRAEQRPRVRRVLTSVPESDVVEMTVIIGIGPRVLAMAIRLERSRPGRGRPGRERQWLCTAIEAA